MPSKKARAKTVKPVGRGKRSIGLTSAIGPKATTAVVVAVLAGGIWFGSHQRLAAKAKSQTPAVEMADMTSDSAAAPAPTPKMSSGARTHETSDSKPVSDAAVASKTAKGSVTTIEGCLVQNGDAFHLKGTTGADAPKARSWKSGFLKKGPASVDVVDTNESLGLANRVGTRVSVTGTLVDREMQAHSIHRLSSNCN
jgi:hypothetical protein